MPAWNLLDGKNMQLATGKQLGRKVKKKNFGVLRNPGNFEHNSV